MNNPKVKCYFCPFRTSVKLFHYMFNGKPVCVCCAAKRREKRERPVFHGRPEFFTREEALVRLQEVRRQQRDIGYERFKAMVINRKLANTGVHVIVPRERFSDIGGYENIKSALRSAVQGAA